MTSKKKKFSEQRENQEKFESRLAPSTARHTPGRPNPMYGTFERAISLRHEVADIAQRIKDLSRNHKDPTGAFCNDVDIVSLMHDEEMEVLYERFAAIMDELDEVEDTRSYMPPPPKREELYFRVQDSAEVIDIGGGSNTVHEQISSIQAHLRTEVIDPQFKVGDQGENTVIEREEELLTTEKVVTSFNSLTQLSREEMDIVDNTDGIHILPDIPELLVTGVATTCDDDHDKVLTRTSAGKVFIDNNHILPKGYKIKNGYKAINTFKERKIEITMKGNFQGGGKGFEPQCLATDKFPAGEMTYKNDGLAVRVEIRDGAVRITDRVGTFCNGVCSDKRLRAIFTCEMLRSEVDDRHAGFLILHRINYWRGYVPFHSGDCLNSFAKKVKISVTFAEHAYEVVGPNPVSKQNIYRANGRDHEIPYDGVIVRCREKDYYLKMVWTVDVCNPEEVHEQLEQHGFDVSNDVGDYGQPDGIIQHGWSEDIHEFSMIVMGPGIIRLEYNKPRPDKANPDPIEKILWRAEQAC